MTRSDHEMATSFERRLAAELRAISDVALRDTPASILARSAVGVAAPRRWPFTPAGRQVALLVAVAAVAGAVLVALVGTSRPAPLPRFRTGELAYVSVANSLDVNTATLYLAEPDGSSPRRIIDSINGGIQWSPSGRYLTVSRYGLDGTTSILVLDSTGDVRSTIQQAGVGGWDWTSADELVVVDHGPEPTLQVYRVDGSQARTLALPPGVARLESWIVSPDGRSLIAQGCERCKGNKYDHVPAFGWDLWRVDLGGGPAARLTQTPEQLEWPQRWMTTNRFEYSVSCWTTPPNVGACPDGDSTQWSMAVDGTGLVQVSPPPGGNMSPDGSTLAIMVEGPGVPWKVRLIDATKGTDIEVAIGPGWDQDYGWSPGSDRLLLLKTVRDPEHATDADRSLWMVGADGSNPHKLTEGSGYGAWQPLPVTEGP